MAACSRGGGGRDRCSPVRNYQPFASPFPLTTCDGPAAFFAVRPRLLDGLHLAKGRLTFREGLAFFSVFFWGFHVVLRASRRLGVRGLTPATDEGILLGYSLGLSVTI